MATATQDFSSTPNVKHPSVHFQNVNAFSQTSPSSDEHDPPENYVVSNFEEAIAMRPRSASHHLSSTKIPSRTWLKIQARIWRGLMSFAIHIPKVKAPKKVTPTFIRKIPLLDEHSEPIELYFYTPQNYYKLRDEGYQFPMVVNFHGGGFCLGHATDDHNWARVCLEQTPCVVISVNYRLAPEHPFPIPVDDGVDALLYLASNAAELGLDPTRTALTGFSAGANLAFSVPLRLEYHTKRHLEAKSNRSSATDLNRWPSTANLLRSASYDPSTKSTTGPNTTAPQDPFATPGYQSRESLTANSIQSSPQSLAPPGPPVIGVPNLNLKIRTVIAWYPLLDWTISRSAKKRASRNPPKCLPKVFTDLFDFSYLPPPDIHGYHCSPYASPALAHDHMLRDGLPADIQMWLCEWDMLLGEGQRFAKRLKELGKSIDEMLVESVPHGFDQSPNPFRDQKKIDSLYVQACVGLKEAFSG